MKNEFILDITNMRVSVKKNKRNINIIRGIDLTVKKAQLVGIVGETGSGKSVLAKSILGVSEGTKMFADKALMDGISLTALKDFTKVRGNRIGYISPEPMQALNPTRKIWKQVNDVLLVHRKDLKSKKLRMTYIAKILEEFGIVDAGKRMFEFPQTFSKEMSQRMSIAMAVASQPQIIIADEPTKRLNAIAQASILGLLGTIRTKFKISVILISKDIATAAKFSDYIYIMYAGKIVEKGMRREVLTDPRHPYTWGLISGMPREGETTKLSTLPGTPPNFGFLPTGDPFAVRNNFALDIDFKKEPPLFEITTTHKAATWLLHPSSPKVSPPADVKKRMVQFKKVLNG